MAGDLVRRNQSGLQSKEKRIPEKLVVLLFERLCDKRSILYFRSHEGSGMVLKVEVWVFLIINQFLFKTRLNLVVKVVFLGVMQKMIKKKLTILTECTNIAVHELMD